MRNWWNKYSDTYEPPRVIEVSTKPVDPEGAKAISTLAHHPGFVALVGKLQLQRAALESQLKSTKFEDIRAVDRIQNGIFWCNWLDSTVRSEVFKGEQVNKPRNAYESETREFQRMFDTLQIVGKE